MKRYISQPDPSAMSNQYIYILKRALIGLFLWSLCVGCGAQKIEIVGQVIQATGIPISRAKVTTMPQTDIVNTDRKGLFRLARSFEGGKEIPIKPGQYQITVSKQGYENLNFMITIKEGKNWAKKRIMQIEQPDVDLVDPESAPEEQVEGGDGPKIGI